MALSDISIGIALAGAQKFKNDMKGVQGQVEGSTKTMAGSFANLAGSIGIAFGVQQIVSFGKQLVSLADTQLKAEAKVQQAIKSTNQAAQLSFEQLKQSASDLQKNTLFGDEQILEGATAQLLTFTNIAGDNFLRTQKLALDLSTVLGTDLKSSSIQLGKALNDPVANLSALSRSGIQFSESQKELIKGLANTNRLAEAQGVILNELERQYGGQAEAAVVGTGRMQQFSNALADVGEKVGVVLIEAMNAFLDIIQPIFNEVSDLFRAFGRLGSSMSDTGEGVSFLTVVLEGLKANFQILLAPMRLLVKAFTFIADGIATLNERFPVLGKILRGIVAPFTLLGDAISFVSDLFSDAEPRVRSFGEVVQTTFNGMTGALREFQMQTGATKDELKEFTKTLDLQRLVNLEYNEAVREVTQAWKEYQLQVSLANQESEFATGSLAQLREQLKGLKTAFEEAGTQAERESIFVDIQKVQAEIKAIEDAFKTVTKEAPPAIGSLDAMQAELSKLESKYKATANTFQRTQLRLEADVLKGQIEIIEKGFDSLDMKTADLGNTLTTVSNSATDFSLTMEGLEQDLNLATLAADSQIDEVSELSEVWGNFRAELEILARNVLPELKAMGVDAIGAIAEGFGASVAGGEEFANVLRKIGNELIVQVPKMLGFAFLNAATTAQPWYVAVAFAAAGLSLLGISGFAAEKIRQAQADQSLDTGGIGSNVLSGTTQASGLSDFTATDTQEINLQGALDGAEITFRTEEGSFRGVIERSILKSDKLRGR
ncbi:MAG: hypothetical protein GWN62_16840 [Aliifodinibius sp.]|nr:hypothetical protein [Fodinibius sp.]